MKGDMMALLACAVVLYIANRANPFMVWHFYVIGAIAIWLCVRIAIRLDRGDL